MAPHDKSTSLSLLERVRDRDEEAWHNLLRLYAPLVERWCAHCGISGPDADDVRQDVFQAVAAGLEQFRRERSGDTFRGWLRVITRNKLIDHARRHQRQPKAQGGTLAQQALQQVAEPALPADSQEDLSGLCHRALELVRSEFEARTWEAFWRAAVEGQPPAVIAADLGVTPAAVRKAKSRVLFRLRQEVGDLIT
jgi:RNA polymerase sigma-70 factor (ECF subfamily)